MTFEKNIFEEKKCTLKNIFEFFKGSVCRHVSQTRLDFSGEYKIEISMKLQSFLLSNEWKINLGIYYLFILEKFCLSRRVLSRIKGIHKSRRYEMGGGRFAKAQRFTLIYKMYIIKWSTLGGVKNVNKISHQCGLWMTTFLTSYLIKFVRMINFEFILLKYYCC